ncbi:MAG: Gfo/Idh/MocA family protein, partial [Pyrinomonadaceae bacterium]
KIGIIGTGFARKVQIPAFMECENARIVSIASAHLANAESAAREFNIAHFTDDWRETVARDDVDLICITTPPALHFEQTLYVIEQGKNVLCEKPMATSAAEAETMTEKARAKNILALVDHELRFQTGRQKAFEILRSGDIGKIRHAKYNFRAPHRSSADVAWNWWSDKTKGGGALGAIGSHIIDSFLWFLGAEISEVFCQLQTHIKRRKDEKTNEPRDVTSDDEALMIMRFAENDFAADATGIVSISMIEQPKYQNRLEFFGVKGALRVSHRGKIFTAKSGADDWTEIDVNLGKAVEGVPDTGFSRGFMEFAPKIIEAILNGATEIKHAATFADGLKVQKVLDAARESNETGCAVKI